MVGYRDPGRSRDGSSSRDRVQIKKTWRQRDGAKDVGGLECAAGISLELYRGNRHLALGKRDVGKKRVCVGEYWRPLLGGSGAGMRAQVKETRTRE